MKPLEWAFYGSIAIALLLALSGCNAIRTLYHACKDRLC